jgi:hypothetical protein
LKDKVTINDDNRLEKEADVIGGKALAYQGDLAIQTSTLQKTKKNVVKRSWIKSRQENVEKWYELYDGVQFYEGNNDKYYARIDKEEMLTLLKVQ